MNIFNLTEEFSSSDVVLNNDRLIEEVNGIYNNSRARRNRSYEDVLRMVRQGHNLEQFLIDKHGFTDNTGEYLDLISPDGFNVDCKTIQGYAFSTELLQKIIDDMKFKNFKYRHNVKYIIVYIVRGLTYKYYDTIEI